MRKILIIILLVLSFSIALLMTIYNVYGIEKVNVNTATKEELMSIPEIGEVLSERIINNRPYYSIEELDKIKGIGEETMKILRERVEL